MDIKHTKSIKTKLFLTNIMGDDRTIIENKSHLHYTQIRLVRGTGFCCISVNTRILDV